MRPQRSMDIFLLIVVVTAGGIALFVGYRIGVKAGFRGGAQYGQMVERDRLAQIERFRLARQVGEPNLLPEREEAEHGRLLLDADASPQENSSREYGDQAQPE